MADYLLDVNHAMALWRKGSPRVTARVAAAQGVVHLCDPCVGELWYRIYNTPQPQESERTMHEFLARFPILAYDAAAAMEFGLIKTAMQRIRRPIADVDSQIAAIARARDVILLTAEQHYSVLPRLRIENWMV